MDAPLLVPPGGGEIIGDSPERRVEILSEHEFVHATWSRFAAGREGADLHVHREHSDLFYVLDGELTVRLGPDGREERLPAGSLALVPPLVVHGFRNGSEADMRYLNFHAPGLGFADYLRSLRDGSSFPFDQHPPPADGGAPPEGASFGEGLVAERPRLRLGLLADTEAIAVAELRVDGSAPVPELHRHRRHVESLYVLDGELAVSTEAGAMSAGAGSWLQLPAGLAHAVAPSGPAAARFLEVHAPSCGFGAYAHGREGEFDMELVAAGPA